MPIFCTIFGTARAVVRSAKSDGRCSVQFNESEMNAIVEVLNALVLQLVDMNSTMSEIYSRTLVEGAYLQGIVDELRTLNYAAGRIEDKISYRP
jgi:hypothetical protein